LLSRRCFRHLRRCPYFAAADIDTLLPITLDISADAIDAAAAMP